MNINEEKTSVQSEQKIQGLLIEKGVIIKQGIDTLQTKGYGVLEKKELFLTLYEALYLLNKEILKVKNKNGTEVKFHNLLHKFKLIDENAWVKYLTYRDLRSRGYVVREGFGLNCDFRVYARGEFNKKTAKYLIFIIQEGKPTILEDLTNTLVHCQSLKKKLILAVMNRRGEMVYYSISQLTLR
jgi:tRNA-intron endonuclease